MKCFYNNVNMLKKKKKPQSVTVKTEIYFDDSDRKILTKIILMQN